jgi:hypothetical protein
MDATSGALLVAALSVVMTPLTAWFTFRWGRDQAREQMKDAREAEAERFSKQEEARRVQRGEQAAMDLIGVVDSAAAYMGAQPTYHQSEYASIYREIRRISLLLTDEGARDRMLGMADCFFFFSSTVHTARSLTHRQAGWVCAGAAHDILHEYLLGRPTPGTPRFDRLRHLVDEGSKYISHEIGEDEPDDLDEPLVSGDVEDAEGSGNA